ncbi:hypothetical protein CAJAP_08821 [Camponotus japonicus]
MRGQRTTNTQQARYIMEPATNNSAGGRNCSKVNLRCRMCDDTSSRNLQQVGLYLAVRTQKMSRQTL